jgi:histidine triad (HIT) family protein
MTYDDENIFAKILKGDIPCESVFEDEHVLSFKDINPQAKLHILIIPKKKFIDIADFLENADPEYQSSFLY